MWTSVESRQRRGAVALRQMQESVLEPEEATMKTEMRMFRCQGLSLIPYTKRFARCGCIWTEEIILQVSVEKFVAFIGAIRCPKCRGVDITLGPISKQRKSVVLKSF